MSTHVPPEPPVAVPQEAFPAVSTPEPPDNSVTPLPASPVAASREAPDAISAGKQQVETPLPAMFAWCESPITPLPAYRPLPPRRHTVRFVGLFSAVACLLISGGIAFWLFALPSLRSLSLLHSTATGTRLLSPGTSTNANTVITSGQPAQTGSTGSNPSGSTRSPGQNQPTGQPAASATPSSPGTSTPSAPPTSTPAAGCLNGSPAGVAVTQVLGISASLPGPIVTLTNCALADGHWTATIQIDSGSGWISCTPESGDIPAKSSQTVHLVIGGANVLLGTYTARVTFTMNNAAWTVSATLVVVL